MYIITFCRELIRGPSSRMLQHSRYFCLDSMKCRYIQLSTPFSPAYISPPRPFLLGTPPRISLFQLWGNTQFAVSLLFIGTTLQAISHLVIKRKLLLYYIEIIYFFIYGQVFSVLIMSGKLFDNYVCQFQKEKDGFNILQWSQYYNKTPRVTFVFTCLSVEENL